MNAISPDHARRARHLATCEELAELGMDIARAAHREALRDLEPRPERRTEIPGLSKSDAPSHPPRGSIFSHLFTAISRCVRQTMMLEARLAAGAFDTYREPTHRTAHTTQTASDIPPREATDDSLSETLHIESFERETPEDEISALAHCPPQKILAEISEKLDDAATKTGLASTPAARPYRRPIPIIPQGPEAPLTQYEKSVLMYHQQQPLPRRKKPDG